MKRPFFLLASALILAVPSMAQDDPVIMKINGQDILRSEFEYFFNRNSQGEELTKKTLTEYADLFIDFKLKVEDAKEEGLDQTEQFLSEFREYRDSQAEEFAMDTAWLETMALQTFENSQMEVGPKGLYQLAALTIVPASTSEEDVEIAAQRMDSLYACIQGGENFRSLAARFSEDQYAYQGGMLGWFSEGQLPRQLGQVVFALNTGEMTKPLLTNVGWQVFKVYDKQSFESFDEHRTAIYEWLREGGFYDRAKLLKARNFVEQKGWEELTDSVILIRYDESLEELYPEFGHISREFYEGLLMFEISNRKIWDPALTDSVSLEKYYAGHKSDYRYEKPVFKGILMFCRDDVAYHEIDRILEGKDQEEWVPAIIDFNMDSVQVRVMRGPFVEGDNAYADKVIFGKDNDASIAGYPVMYSRGTMLKAPEDWTDVSGQVVADYQDMLEKEWVKSLRKKYKYKVNKKVLYTVNNH